MPERKTSAKEAEIQEIQAAEEEKLLGMANVVAVGSGSKVTNGIDTGQPCLSVFVTQKLDDPADLRKEDKIKSTIAGVPTDVVETGEIFALQELMETEVPPTEEVEIQVLRNRVRPAQGGYSVGHFRITAGTFATAVYDAKAYPGIPPRYYVLSNNHVLANSNSARIGDPILQPGPIDGGSAPRDVIARLSNFVRINFAGLPNYVDAAIAEGDFHVLNREIYWIGYVRGSAPPPPIGTVVQKTGRTTNYTTGRVLARNATVNVNYGSSGVARFVRQTITSNMSAGGDSGSLLLDMENRAVGLLFAGSSRVTIHNDIRYVQRMLGIRIA